MFGKLDQFLLFQLGEHGKALGIFVHKIKDVAAAENYCDQVNKNH